MLLPMLAPHCSIVFSLKQGVTSAVAVVYDGIWEWWCFRLLGCSFMGITCALVDGSFDVRCKAICGVTGTFSTPQCDGLLQFAEYFTNCSILHVYGMGLNASAPSGRDAMLPIRFMWDINAQCAISAYVHLGCVVVNCYSAL